MVSANSRRLATPRHKPSYGTNNATDLRLQCELAVTQWLELLGGQGPV